MSRSGNQQRVFLGFLAQLRPHWRSDLSLPSRIEAMLRRDGRLGSRDRRLYRELCYATLRYLSWIEPLLDQDPDGAVRRAAWLSTRTPATEAFRIEVCKGMPECPALLEERAALLNQTVRSLFPSWVETECPEVLSPACSTVLLSRAPLWLRLQTGNPEQVFEEFRSRGWICGRSGKVPDAVEMPPDIDVTSTEAYARGAIEVQDIGSQLIVDFAGALPGERWLDACAGAGGKTLQLAQRVGHAGQVAAQDPRASALAELKERAERAGVSGQISTTSPRGTYDGVLVDAPCSGSGTWRRSPHLKWMTTQTDVRTAAQLQKSILHDAAAFVKQGGSLVYSTCSLCRTENEDQIADFLSAHDGFEPGCLDPGAPLGRRIEPALYNGDGYYVAVLRRKTG